MEFSVLEKENLPECVALYIDVFNNPPWNESWSTEVVSRRMEDCFNTPGFYGLSIQVNGALVGFALGNIEPWDRSSHFYLKEICVATDQQRQGHGSALMEELETRLKAQEVEKLYLFTARETPAQAFYEKHGYYVSPKMIMMAKWLNPR